MKLEHSLTTYAEINLKWFKELNAILDTIRLLEETVSKTYLDINHSSIFLDHFPKAKEMKAKNKQMGLNQN